MSLLESEFVGKKDAFSLPYGEIKDFCITKDGRGKTYFTMLGVGKMYEGQILDLQEIEPFTSALNAKLGGAIHIEVRKY